ncbi:leucine-rich repeat protein [Psychroserpens sp. NJDZ02]|uniref:leucine-rich repeat protein n=1 Tax=Psychroserpens sp. NJDZ02 TaxID=2570561 RepID=UPI0010A8A608|nr:leucine-rich repeat protein [Psychroserpens sp. NJDZ02]QCE42350.1 hypothetical protein E9099_13365 [Psychroserpens sp. NJDZ02]
MKTIFKQLLCSVVLILAMSCGVDGVDGVDGQDGVDGVDGQDGMDGADGTGGQATSGLTYVYFNGGITDAEAVTKVQNEIGSITQFIYVENTTQLTTLDLSSVSQLITLIIDDNVALTTINISNLVEVSQEIRFRDNPLVSSLNLSSLEKVSYYLYIEGSADLNTTSLQQVDFSALSDVHEFYLRNSNVNNVDVSNLTDVYSIEFEENVNLTALDLSSITTGNAVAVYENPNLTTIDLSNLINTNSNLGIFNNDVLTSVDLSSLVTVSQFTISQNSQLVTINLPQLVTAASSFNLYDNISLTTITFPALTSFSQVYFPGNNFSSSDVNTVLSQLVAISPTFSGKNVRLNNQQISAPPTGQGVADYNTLVANGNSVTTD